MFDVGFSELVVVGVVALIVVGPRDLPAMFQTVGRFTARARSMAREFQRAMDDAAKASGVSETMKDVRDMTSKKSLGLTALENAAEKFEKWNPMEAAKPAGKPAATPAKDAAPPAEPAAAAAAETAKPAPARKLGAHTRALSEQIEKDRAERRARAASKPAAAKVAAAETPAPAEPAKPAKKAARKAPAAAPATATVTAEAAPAPKPKAARKPRQGKTEA